MKGLLIVDVQRDFCMGGSLEVRGAEEIIPVINGLIHKFKDRNMFMAATKDWHPADHGSFASNSGGNIGEVGELKGLPQVWWPDHCVQDTPGSEFHRDLDSVENIIYKGCDKTVDSYSAFFDNGKLKKTDLDELLKSHEVDELYIVGLATDYCVRFTVLDALELGYKVNLILDGCRGVDISPEDSEKAVEEMRARGAVITDSKSISLN